MFYLQGITAEKVLHRTEYVPYIRAWFDICVISKLHQLNGICIYRSNNHSIREMDSLGAFFQHKDLWRQTYEHKHEGTAKRPVIRPTHRQDRGFGFVGFFCLV